eukprot:6948547-Pyramimonas_sp.AAC.1
MCKQNCLSILPPGVKHIPLQFPVQFSTKLVEFRFDATDIPRNNSQCDALPWTSSGPIHQRAPKLMSCRASAKRMFSAAPPAVVDTSKSPVIRFAS